MEPTLMEEIENGFTSLSPEEKFAIITHGTALYLSTLEKRLFLAQAKVRQFEEAYGISLSELDARGLPDEADYQMHEDYLMWHHWADSAEKLTEQVDLLQPIGTQGLYAGEALHVGN
ncbi:MAG: hypothetical protein KAJ81_02930 [Candidatus Latescibacteria bacterium]|nr:hypothetical protein [Candidatus Latescibacterota bacterium]MCK5328008.1 hypothetical protein [Candidatus Latescibacterota bacterium]MCK5380396.1 hypothetical protein [Candidatus Latescibacterota bacterium]